MEGFSEILKIARAAVLDTVSSLSPTEHTIVARRYGLSGDEPRTPNDIAADVCLNRERVRRLQRRVEDRVRKAISGNG